MNARYRLMLTFAFPLALAGCSADQGTGVARPLDLDAFLAKGGGAKIHKPVPVSSARLDVNGCEFTVTYSWSNFRGENLTAVVGLYQAGTVARIAEVSVTEQASRSGTVTHTFTLTAGGYPAGRYVLGMGRLLDRDLQEVSGSNSGSTLVWSDCG
jgi:hypothetical protein